MSASDEIWILGIRMTKFGKHPDWTPLTWPPRPRSARWPTPG